MDWTLKRGRSLFRASGEKGRENELGGELMSVSDLAKQTHFHTIEYLSHVMSQSHRIRKYMIQTGNNRGVFPR